MNTIEYLNKTKKALGVMSDYALAKQLGMARSNASSLMNGKSTMGDETALKVAHILGIHPVIVLADAHAEREKNPELRAVWMTVMEKFSVGFKALTLCCIPRQA